jgi:hypothetical protein
VLGRHAASAVTSRVSFIGRYFSRTGTGAVISMCWIWFTATVRALTAERRALFSARNASIDSSFTAAAARSDSTARAAS